MNGPVALVTRGFVPMLLVGACGGGAAPVADAEPSVDAGETISVTGTISEWLSPSATGPAIEGAEVCVLGTTRCAITDATGVYTLVDAVPASRDFGIAITAEGYLRTVLLWRPEPDDLADVRMSIVTDAVAEQKVSDAGGTWPLDTTGIVEVGAYVFDGSFTPAQGLTATMSPASGTGAVYLGTDGYPDTSLTSTSTVGLTMFVNVTPGTVAITSTLGGHTCVRAQDGWNGDAPGTVAVPAEAGTLTYVNEACAPR